LLKIERNFKTDFVDLSDSPSINEQMKIFFDLHQKRWTAKGFSGAFADRKVANFHLDIARRFSKKGWLGLFMLRLSDVPAAALYGFRYNSKFYYYLSGFDPKFFEYSVGSLLTSFAIERSIKEGFVEFDFTRGGEEYKNHWNTMTRWNYRAVLTQPGVIPSIKHRIYEGFWQYGTSLQHILHI
jgi:CelD/BcsL family acetyltransferase involved in cellulose biosynthesis